MRTIVLAALVAVPLALPAQPPAASAAPVANAQGTALERSVASMLNDWWDAFAKQDAARFAPYVAEDGVMISYMGIGDMKRADAAAIVKSCTTRTWSTSNLKVKPVAPDIVTATYDAAVDQTCDGKVQPPNYHVSDVLVKRGDRWVSVLHHETVAAP